MFRRSLTIQLVLVGAAAIVLTALIMNSEMAKRKTADLLPDWVLLLLFIWLAAALLAVFGAYLGTRMRYASSLDDRLRIEQIQKDEAGLARQAGVGTEFSELWSLTQRRIDHYHHLATSQSAIAFRTGQTVMGLGFAVVLALGVAAALAPNGTAAIAASVIAVAGAALSAFVSATFLRSQAEASAQLREFFMQPVEFTRMLGAERLLDLLDDPTQKAIAVQAVITSLAGKGPERASKTDISK